MEYRYLPALMPGGLQEFDGAGPMHWLDPKLPEEQKYKNLLLSYAVWAGKDAPFSSLPDAHILGDSGGFSVISTGAKIDPRRSVRWQIRNTTVGVILDIPPFDFGGKSRFVGSAADVLAKSIERTTSNVRLALPFYLRALDEGSRFRWWGVVQGESYAQLEQWYDAVTSVYSFQGTGEGWALAPKPCNDVLVVTRFMRLAREREMKRIHVLQTSKVGTVGVMLALAKKAGIEFVTNDSATVHINAGNRNAFMADPDGLGGAWEGAAHRTGWTGVRDFLLSRCSCASCELLRIEGDRPEFQYDRYFKDRLAYHNFCSLLKVNQNLHQAAEKDPDDLLRRCAGRYYGQVLREWEGVEQTATAKKTVSIFDRF